MDDDPSLVINKNLIKDDEHISKQQQQKKIKLNSIYDCIDDKNFDDSNHDYNKNKFSFIKYSSISSNDLVNNNVQFRNETNKNYVRRCFIIACDSFIIIYCFMA